MRPGHGIGQFPLGEAIHDDRLGSLDGERCPRNERSSALVMMAAQASGPSAKASKSGIVGGAGQRRRQGLNVTWLDTRQS